MDMTDRHEMGTNDSDRAIRAEVRMISSDKCWIDGKALEQLHKAATLPGMLLAVGLPDLHAGIGCPVGSAFAASGVFYPHLIGTDIGCGIALWHSDLPAAKTSKILKWADKLEDLDEPWDGDATARLAACGVEATEYDASLGTIGAGNHFAELQKVEKVLDPQRFDSLKLDSKQLMLLVHSGSRGLGKSVVFQYTGVKGGAGTDASDEAGRAYLAGHDRALAWAKANRALIAGRFLSCLGATAEPVCDTPHNFLEQAVWRGQSVWLHRKGAAPSDRGVLVIPGSRGAWSYLVEPCGDGETSAFSLAHGAGRKWERSSCRGRLERHYSVKQLSTTELGGHVLCTDRDLLYEEAPQVYKNIETVINAMESRGLMNVIATFRPLLTYKIGKHRTR
jgi:release factor H-coupled RctB family protein